YEFPEFVKLGVGNFYVGWTQTSNDNLNVGFDRNTNSQNKNFYNVDGSWVNSSFDGSIMIRPVLGKALSPQLPEVKSNEFMELVIYPNPPIGTDEIFIDLPPGSDDPAGLKYLTLSVNDLYGRMIISGSYRDRISTLNLKPGLYIVNLTDALQGKSYSAKLLIVK
ncbi:MAG: T9SS type A sorting domain-containing protein, partial [Bacteroidales bacterium]